MGIASKIFISCAIGLIMANVVYYSTRETPNALITNMFSGIVGTLSSALIVLAITSTNALTVSLSDSFVSLLITVVILINLFFRINVGGFDVGFGLLTNIITLMNPAGGTLFNIGNMFITIIGILMFLSSLIMVTGGE